MINSIIDTFKFFENSVADWLYIGVMVVKDRLHGNWDI